MTGDIALIGFLIIAAVAAVWLTFNDSRRVVEEVEDEAHGDWPHDGRR